MSQIINSVSESFVALNRGLKCEPTESMPFAPCVREVVASAASRREGVSLLGSEICNSL